MKRSLENQIRELLNELGDAGLVADELVKRWERHLLSEHEQFELSQFLLKGGFYPTLLQQIARLLQEKRPIPWPHLIEALGAIRFSFLDEHKQAIAQGCEEQNAWDQLLLSRRPDDWGDVFQKQREEFQKRETNRRLQQKNEWLDKLEFMRSQRLFQEEARILETLCHMFPQDAELRNEQHSYEQRWARDVIARHTSLLDASIDWTQKLENLSPEMQIMKDVIVERADELATEQTQRAMDLSLLLFFMEFYPESLSLLEKAPDSLEKKWFRLELLLLSKKYLETLEESSKLETELAENPEATFGVAYARARALWGLGQNNMAVDLMRGIVKVRPSYRSAHSLLMDWTGGTF